jgi:F-type H+-transporting ATPase subunit b
MELNGTIFIQIFIFGMALLWLSPSLFVPIIRLFEERDRRIKGAKIESEELNALALEKAKVFDVQYEKAKDKAREFLTQIKQTTEKAHAERIAQVKSEAAAKLKLSEADLKDQCQQVRARLDGEASQIAGDIVNALLRRHA